MKKLVSFIFIGLSFLMVFSQTDKTEALAKQYYQKGDYEKAAQLYEELWKDQSGNTYYYTYLFNSLIRLNEYDQLETIVKKQQKKYKTDVKYKVDLGYVYSQNNQAEKAEAMFEEALESLTNNENSIRTLASKFTAYRQDDYVIKVYEQGNELLENPTKFSYELGNAYLKKGNPTQAVAQWLLLIKEEPNRKSAVQSIISRNLEKEDVADQLETQLYKYIQQENTRDEYPEMLIWLFTNQKDFESALIQAKALDKRNSENGHRVYSLGNNAVREEDYDAAIEAYQYLIDKGESSQYFRPATSEQLKARKSKVTSTEDYTDEDIAILQSSFENYVLTYGKNNTTANTVRELANLEANYLYNLDKAIALLDELIATPGLNKKTKNETKLDLGDLYILKGEVWEATLLYAQVDKDEKDSPLGEDARFRNARLSYFKGEFEWAQAQLGVLKGATTELIANDALDLSVFIMDNLGLDTTTIPMEKYADAQLKMLQNKHSDALIIFDEIIIDYPKHVLEDNVLLEKAKIKIKQRDFETASGFLQQLLTAYPEDILADNASFLLGEIYERYLNDNEKAMEYYKLIITDYSDSVLVVAARKRFRTLRGDES